MLFCNCENINDIHMRIDIFIYPHVYVIVYKCVIK